MTASHYSNKKRPARRGQRVEQLRHVVLGMRCHHREAQAALALGHGGRADAVEVDAARVQVLGNRNGLLRVADVQGHDLRLRGREVKAHRLQPGADAFCIVPKPVARTGIALDEVERGRGGGTGVGRHRGRVNIGRGSVANQVDELLAAADKSPRRAQGLATRGHVNVNRGGRQAKVVKGAAAMRAERAGRMGIIYHQDGAVAFGEGDEFRQGGDVPIH